MKRLNNVFDRIISFENLMLAHQNARKDKSHYSSVKIVDSNPEYYINKIREMLINGEYKVSDYDIFTKKDGEKERVIYKLPYYPDRIIQWAIMLQIKPRFEKHFIRDTYSSIPERGIHLALKRINKALCTNPLKTQYYLKIDISKFYPSIDQNILKSQLRKIFKDERLLKLLDTIINSLPEEKGIPIGSYLSQYFGNYFLSDIDHYCKEQLKIKYYYRYMDDIVILAENKKTLWKIFHKLKEKIESKNLTIKLNYKIAPVNISGLDFVGYRIFKNRIILRKAIYKKAKKRLKFLSKITPTERQKSSYGSYVGWLNWTTCENLQIKLGVKQI